MNSRIFMRGPRSKRFNGLPSGPFIHQYLERFTFSLVVCTEWEEARRDEAKRGEVLTMFMIIFPVCSTTSRASPQVITMMKMVMQVTKSNLCEINSPVTKDAEATDVSRCKILWCERKRRWAIRGREGERGREAERGNERDRSHRSPEEIAQAKETT
jgi:hypothetical protein